MEYEYCTDNMNRRIKLEIDDAIDDCAIVAYCEGDYAGKFLYRKIESPDKYRNDIYTYKLYNMNIREKYQRAGIGTEIIKFGKKIFENVSYPDAFAGREEDHYASEGFSFMDHCIDIGVLDSGDIYHEDNENEEYMDDEYLKYLMETEKEDIE